MFSFPIFHKLFRIPYDASDSHFVEIIEKKKETENVSQNKFEIEFIIFCSNNLKLLNQIINDSIIFYTSRPLMKCFLSHEQLFMRSFNKYEGCSSIYAKLMIRKFLKKPGYVLIKK